MLCQWLSEPLESSIALSKLQFNLTGRPVLDNGHENDPRALIGHVDRCRC